MPRYFTVIAAAATALCHAGSVMGTKSVLVDYGYWNVTVESGSAASGYRWNDIYANYSAAPDQQNHCHWLYSPIDRTGTTTCEGNSFNASLDYDLLTIEQTVPMLGTSLNLTGSARMHLKCGLGGSGRGCEGSTTVPAVLREAGLEK